ncbi:MAG: MoxR family ATPase [Cyanobacteria bacterium]|nr:MoxR family ATPase [Cyanobacteriota bacterium]
MESSIEPLQIAQTLAPLKNALSQIVFGQEKVIDQILIGLLADGHLLIEGIPGTAKTTLVKTLAQLVNLDFRRIQLTPDMLPSEITGTSLYDLNQRQFIFKKGPVFTDILLADEINRTPPKTQSALLEAMEEHQVTVDGENHPLPNVFTVIATLNPIEFEGTYPLPEAQLDRFMMKIQVSYPEKSAELEMLRKASSPESNRYYQDSEALQPVLSREAFIHCKKALSSIIVDDTILDYILELVGETRKNPSIELGCSPRSAIYLLNASRGHAALSGQDFVSPDNVKSVAPAVLRHRLVLTSEAEFDGLIPEDVIQQTLNRIPIPR